MENAYNTIKNTAYAALASVVIGFGASSCNTAYRANHESVGFCENTQDSSALEKTLDSDSVDTSKSDNSVYVLRE